MVAFTLIRVELKKACTSADIRLQTFYFFFLSWAYNNILVSGSTTAKKGKKDISWKGTTVYASCGDRPILHVFSSQTERQWKKSVMYFFSCKWIGGCTTLVSAGSFVQSFFVSSFPRFTYVYLYFYWYKNECTFIPLISMWKKCIRCCVSKAHKNIKKIISAGNLKKCICKNVNEMQVLERAQPICCFNTLPHTRIFCCWLDIFGIGFCSSVLFDMSSFSLPFTFSLLFPHFSLFLAIFHCSPFSYLYTSCWNENRVQNLFAWRIRSKLCN